MSAELLYASYVNDSQIAFLFSTQSCPHAWISNCQKLVPGNHECVSEDISERPLAENVYTGLTKSSNAREYCGYIAVWVSSNSRWPNLKLDLMLRRHGSKEDLKLAKECAEVMASWPSRAVACRLYCSGSVLPLDIWIQILQTLCRDIEKCGVRSASVIARDICNASMASKEMWTASQIALKHLSSLCPLSPPLCKYEQSWNQYFASPTSIQASEISALMIASVGTVRYSALGLPWDQPACTVLFLRKFHLYRPTNTPFRLILAVQHERAPSLLIIRLLLQIESRLSIPDPSAGLKRVLQHPMSKHVTDKEFRRLLTQMGIQVMADLEQAFVTKQRQTQFFKQLLVMLEHELSWITNQDEQSFVSSGSCVGYIYSL